MREFERAIAGLTGRQRQLGVSIGLAHINLSRPINAEQIILHADGASYAAKNAGKNHVMLRDTDGVYAPMTAA